jgi:Thioesterase-like superfamily
MVTTAMLPHNTARGRAANLAQPGAPAADVNLHGREGCDEAPPVVRYTVEKDAALFVPDGRRFVPTHYSQGPHDPGAQFGGAPAALIATLVDTTPSLVPMQIARLTTDLMRPVPLTPLTPEIHVVREGKKIQVVVVSLYADGVEVTRATALRIRHTVVEADGLPDGRFANPLPTEPRPVEEDFFQPEPPGSRLAMEYLFEGSGGYYSHPGWMRLRVDVIAGERPHPVARLAYSADTASGVGHVPEVAVSWINADVAINVVREPVGEWLSLDGRSWIGHTGSGQVQATISDTEGIVSTISMVRFVNSPTGS